MKLFALIFPFLAIIIACQKDIPDPAEEIKNVVKADNTLQKIGDYPSIYPVIDKTQLKPIQEAYAKRNPYMYTGITSFGFCGYEETDLNRSVPFPDKRLAIDEDKASRIFNIFIKENFALLGLSDSLQNLPGNVNSDCLQSDTCMGWSFESVNQFVGDMEVLHSRIVMHLFNGQMFSCTGNWYPVINIPEAFTVPAGKAKELLNGRTVVHYSIAGEPFYVTIQTSDLESSAVTNVIVPVKDERSIMLRVTWEINIPGPVYYKIYVDVMTGEIVMAVPTIIS
ncbi:MAG TPA: hypothetical protein VK179_18250 [Bacteroidales bacterium]|nr:hypothetical protein [Bacteroidales bacterium]